MEGRNMAWPKGGKIQVRVSRLGSKFGRFILSRLGFRRVGPKSRKNSKMSKSRALFKVNKETLGQTRTKNWENEPARDNEHTETKYTHQ